MGTRGSNRAATWGGRGNSPASGENVPVRLPPIQWDATRTELLVSWLLNHAADRHILFHDKNTGGPSSAPPAAPGDKPSGCNKKEVRLAIASHIFAGDPVYGGQWAVNSDKFQLSVMNRLVSLKDKYREHVKSLNQTGAGVAPGTTSNLRETIISTFPHFEDLDSIWRGNPSFDARPFTSDQRTNRSEDMLSLVRGGATCPGDDLFTTNSGDPAVLQESAATGDQGVSSTPWGDYDYGGTGEDDGQEGEHAGDYDFQDDAGGTFYRRDDDAGGIPYRRDDDIGGAYRRDDDIGGTFGDDIEMDESTGNDAGYSAGVQTWRETVSSGMQIRSTPQTKRRTKSWDSRDTSKFTETSYRWGTPAPTSGGAPSSSSHPRHRFASPYSRSSEPSLTRGRKPAVGRAKTDIPAHLENLRREAELLRGERASNSSTKYEYAIHSKELVFRREEAIHQRHEAELNHRRQKESKQLDIELTTAQTQLFEKQAEALRLQIMLAELEAKKRSGSASGGAGVSDHEAL
ncbi:hypothetical protein EDD15DRAFT_2367549 [Pisolithus albus]|nr:hypothetical protein EDD15DRAFT_2367549 [Pisolithus albus]